MNIQILGIGCAKCKELEENVKKAVEETKTKAQITKVTQIEKIIEYGVMATPAIVIDGQLKSYGKVSSINEIKKWL